MVELGKKEATNNSAVPESYASHHFSFVTQVRFAVSEDHRPRSDHNCRKHATQISQISSDIFIQIGAVR
jgi:hypothetical protein